MSGATPASFAKALQERRRRERRRKRSLIIAAVATALALAAVVGVVRFSPWLRLTGITVEGNALVTSDAVIEAAAQPLGGALMAADADAVAERVRTVPEVADVKVSRHLPHTLVITVEERRAVYQLGGNGFGWVDATGTIFHTTPAAEPGIPVATATDPDQRLRADIATVVDHLPPALDGKVSAIKAAAVDQITLRLANGDVVVWGSAEESELKGAVLAALLSTEAKRYDVSAPGQPTTS